MRVEYALEEPTSCADSLTDAAMVISLNAYKCGQHIGLPKSKSSQRFLADSTPLYLDDEANAVLPLHEYSRRKAVNCLAYSRNFRAHNACRGGSQGLLELEQEFLLRITALTPIPKRSLRIDGRDVTHWLHQRSPPTYSRYRFIEILAELEDAGVAVGVNHYQAWKSHGRLSGRPVFSTERVSVVALFPKWIKQPVIYINDGVGPWYFEPVAGDLLSPKVVETATSTFRVVGRSTAPRQVFVKGVSHDK